MAPGPGKDEERLPWLEPYRETAAAKRAPVAPPKKRGAGLVVGGVAALAAAVTAGYYIGQRDARPPTPVTEIAVAPSAPVPPVAPPVAAPPPVEAPNAVVSPAVEAEPKVKAGPKKIASASARNKARRAARARQRKIRSAGIEAARLEEVRAAQERSRAPPPSPPVTRSWPKMPSPGPAGQVIQLGAFKNSARAHAAYRTRLARYPMLGSMPRVVVPVVTKPHGQILYVLRLGTTSRQQSRTICRNLRASGDHCLVIG